MQRKHEASLCFFQHPPRLHSRVTALHRGSVYTRRPADSSPFTGLLNPQPDPLMGRKHRHCCKLPECAWPNICKYLFFISTLIEKHFFSWRLSSSFQNNIRSNNMPEFLWVVTSWICSAEVLITARANLPCSLLFAPNTPQARWTKLLTGTKIKTIDSIHKKYMQK